MTEQELRAIVRDAIARQAGAVAPAAPQPPSAIVRLHSSHRLLQLPAGSEMDGLCLIEPAVPCNHCGYCQSYGH